MSKSRITTEKRRGRGAHLQEPQEAARPQKLPPIHPREVLAHTLNEAGISATRAAIAMGLPPSTLTRIMKGQRNVTAPIALRIARYLDTSPDLWMGIQTDYDLEIAKDREGTSIDREVRPLGQLRAIV